MVVAVDARAAKTVLDRGGVGVLVCGGGLPVRDALSLAEKAASVTEPPSVIVTLGGDDLTPFQDLVDRDAMFYLSRIGLDSSDLATLVRRALDREVRGNTVKLHSIESEHLRRLRAIAESARTSAAATTFREVSWRAATTALDITSADRAYCLVVDAENHLLRSPTLSGWRAESVVTGLAGFAVRAATSVTVEVVGTDPRYDYQVDDPEGDGTQRLLAQPVLDQREGVVGVIVVVREASREAFVGADIDALAYWGSQISGALTRFIVQPTGSPWHEASGPAGQAIRAPVARFIRNAPQARPELEMSPTWNALAYPLVAIALVASALFASRVTTREVTSGSAALRARADGAYDVTAVLPIDVGAELSAGLTARLTLNSLNGSHPSLPLRDVRVPVAATANGHAASASRRVSDAPRSTLVTGLLSREVVESLPFRPEDASTGRVEVDLGRRPLLETVLEGLFRRRQSD